MLGEHAVVVGGSIAGLLAARAVADSYERVTILDRDALPDGLGGRRAVPQGRHAHGLLPRGQTCLEALLPGLGDELVAGGGQPCAMLEQMRFVAGGHELARASLGLEGVLAGRPFIEGHVRRRVRALPGVTLVERRAVTGLETANGRVAGVRADAGGTRSRRRTGG